MQVSLKGPKYGLLYNQNYYDIKNKTKPEIILGEYYIYSYNQVGNINNTNILDKPIKYNLDINSLKIQKDYNNLLNIGFDGYDSLSVLHFRYNKSYFNNIKLYQNILEIYCDNLIILKPNDNINLSNLKYTTGRLEIILTDKGLERINKFFN